MNFDGDMIRWGTFDISELKRRVIDITDEMWLANGGRQEKYDVHKSTQTIPLVVDDGSGTKPPTVLPQHAEYVDILSPLYEYVARCLTGTTISEPLIEGKEYGYLVNSILVKLLPESRIPGHMDSGFSLTHSHRIHVPLITSDNVHFAVGEMSADMKEGEVWEINNRHIHQVENSGTSSRTHLILDWRFPSQSCCCGSKKHPTVPCTPLICDPELRLCDCYAS